MGLTIRRVDVRRARLFKEEFSKKMAWVEECFPGDVSFTYEKIHFDRNRPRGRGLRDLRGSESQRGHRNSAAAAAGRG